MAGRNTSQTAAERRKEMNAAARRKRKRKRAFRKFMDVTAAVLILGLFGAAVSYPLVTGMITIDPMTGQEALGTVKETDAEGEFIMETTEAPTESLYETITIDNGEMYKGELILVNADYPFESAADASITTLFEEKTESYSVSGMDVAMQEAAIEPLNDMLDAFCSETGHDDILVIDAYRTFEKQQELYDADLELTGLDTSTLVALPGHSEHETGYALDFSLFFSDGSSGEYDGTGDYDWIDQHCADYGYILRYPADKTEITKIQYESWHYRYVGRPHAYYIMQRGICFEEYIDELREHPIEEPLEIVDSDGSAYAVYYVPAETDKTVTYAPIISEHPYTISGNNADGFIITVDLEEKRELVSYTKPVEEVTGITTDEYGNVVTSETSDNAASGTTTTTTTVHAVG